MVLYKRAEFKFKPGTTFIQARNLNSPGRGSNFSGKSLLFTSLANVLGAEPMITNNARTHHKDLYGSKGATIKVELERRGHSYTVVKRKTKLAIHRDGKDLKLRTQQLATAYLQKLLDVNEEEFFTLYYVDSRRPSAFQFGTKASRFEFFTNLFRLGDLDATRKWLRQNLTKLREDQVAADRVGHELKELGPTEDLEEREQQLEELKARRKKLTRHNRSLQEDLHLIEMYRVWKPLKRKHAQLADKVGVSGKAARDKLKDTERRLADLESARKQNARAIEQQRQRKDLERRLQDLRSPVESVERAQRLLTSIDNAKREARKVEKPQRVEPVDERVLKKTLEALGVNVELAKTTSPDLDRVAAKCEARLDALERDWRDFSKHFKHGEDSQCPTCKSTLSASMRTRMKEAFGEQRRKLTERAQHARQAQDLLHRHHQHIDYLDKRHAWKQVQGTLDKYSKYKVDELLQFIRLTERLKDLPKRKVETLDTEEDERKLRKRRDTLRELLGLEQQLQDYENVDRLAQAADMVESDIRQLLKRNDDKLDEVIARLSKAQSKVDRANEHNERRRRLKKELKALSQNLEDIPLYDAMIEAYSTGGMKMLLIKKVAKMVEQKMNAGAKSLYQEPYRFEFHVEDGRFDVLVHRNLAGKVVTSDIRRLSGAESRIFSVLLLWSILPFIPEERRLNFLVLDEPETNVDQSGLQIFREVLIPKLSQMIPSLVVISTNESLMRPGARVMTVVKKGNQSTLVKGRVKDSDLRSKSSSK